MVQSRHLGSRLLTLIPTSSVQCQGYLPLESTSANQLRQVPSSSKDAPLIPEHKIQSIQASPLARLPRLLPYSAIGSITVDKSGTAGIVTTIRQTSRHLGKHLDSTLLNIADNVTLLQRMACRRPIPREWTHTQGVVPYQATPHKMPVPS